LQITDRKSIIAALDSVGNGSAVGVWRPDSGLNFYLNIDFLLMLNVEATVSLIVWITALY